MLLASRLITENDIAALSFLWRESNSQTYRSSTWRTPDYDAIPRYKLGVEFV